MSGPEQQPPGRIVGAPGRVARRFGMGGEPFAHQRLGHRRALFARRGGRQVAQPAETVQIVGKGRPDRQFAEIDRVDRQLLAPEQEIAGTDRLAGARVAGHDIVRHRQQFERIFALQPPAVQRRLPAQPIEMIGDPLGQRQALVIRDADEPLALFDAIVGQVMTGLDRDRGGLAPLVRHPPRSVLILSA